jgi:S1-C subfamily serine protease
VAAVRPGSRAARGGLRPGDVVVAVNRKPVTTVSELVAELRNVEGGVALEIVRDDARIYVLVR